MIRFVPLRGAATIVTLGVGLTLAATALVAYAPWATRVGGSPSVLTYADGYPLDDSPAAAAAFEGNEIVVLAEVIQTLPARWNTGESRRGDLAFIYTPVRVRVLDVFRGAPRLEEQIMVIRRLGGRVGDEELVVAEDLAPASLSAPGNRVLLFLGEQRDVGDGLQAATPNMVYVVDTSGRAVSTDGGHIITLDAFRVLIQS
jgi:hypothetical protein